MTKSGEVVTEPGEPKTELSTSTQPLHDIPLDSISSSETLASPKNGLDNSTATSLHNSEKPGVAAEVAEEPGRPTHPELTKKSKIIIVLSLCMCTFLAALDQTIISTAIPVLAAQFHSPSAYQWIGSSYLLGSVSFLPSWGKFSDIWGRKPVLLTAAALFLIGSVLCAAAHDMALLLVGRTIQGIGGGGLLGLVNVTIADIVSIRERGIYLSFIGMTWALASSIGPVLGGVFTDMAFWGWRMCFIINLPFGAIAITGIVINLHLHSPKLGILEGLARIDWLGTWTVLAASVLFLVGLEFGGVQHPWDSPMVLCLIIIGGLLFVAFALIEWKFAKEPIVPARLFRTRTAICSYLLAFTHGFVFIAGCYFIPFFFQSVRGASPLMSGVYVLPYVILLSVFSGATGVVIAKTGRYQELIWGGSLLMCLGAGLMINLDRTSPWSKLVIYQMIVGTGCAPLFQSPLIAIHATIEPRDIGTATTAFAFVRTFGTALAISLGLVVFNNQMAAQKDELLEKLPQELATTITGGSASAAIEWMKKFSISDQNVARDAFAVGVRGMWYFFLAMAVVATVCSAGVGKHHLSKQNHATQPAMNKPKKKESTDKVDVAA